MCRERIRVRTPCAHINSKILPYVKNSTKNKEQISALLCLFFIKRLIVNSNTAVALSEIIENIATSFRKTVILPI
jgi:hypothetical protein